DPGLGYEYSNLGFATLGYIIKKVTGQSYQQYITQNILKPLGMTHTYYEYTRVPPGLLAHGYQWKEGKWQEEGLLHDGAFGAMGGMISSIADFSKYMALHLSAWPPRDGAEGPVLKRSSLREMQSPHQFSGLQTGFRYASGRPCPSSAAYGFGLRWSIDCANKVFVGHSGGLPGFGSNWTILPEYGIGVVCFANLTYAPTAQLNLSILDTLVRIAGLQKRLLPPSPWLEQRKKALLALLPEWKDAKNSGIFAENFFPDHPLADLRAEARRLFARAGTIRQVSALVAENNLRGSFVLEGEKASLLVSFTLSPQNPPLIQEYHLSLVPEN
ncbi:MAG: serine hydrolase domain-containing protein, partial [Flavisolibacter sp.]